METVWEIFIAGDFYDEFEGSYDDACCHAYDSGQLSWSTELLIVEKEDD